MAQWVARMTRNRSVISSNPLKAPDSFRKKLYPDCLVLVGSMNRFEHDFTIKFEGLKEY